MILDEYGFDNNPDAPYDDCYDSNQQDRETPDYDSTELGENVVPAKCRCDICGHVFKDSEIVITKSQEYPSARMWDNYVSPCCLSHNFTELED